MDPLVTDGWNKSVHWYYNHTIVTKLIDKHLKIKIKIRSIQSDFKVNISIYIFEMVVVYILLLKCFNPVFFFLVIIALTISSTCFLAILTAHKLALCFVLSSCQHMHMEEWSKNCRDKKWVTWRKASIRGRKQWNVCIPPFTDILSLSNSNTFTVKFNMLGLITFCSEIPPKDGLGKQNNGFPLIYPKVIA